MPSASSTMSAQRHRRRSRRSGLTESRLAGTSVGLDRERLRARAGEESLGQPSMLWVGRRKCCRLYNDPRNLGDHRPCEGAPCSEYEPRSTRSRFPNEQASSHLRFKGDAAWSSDGHRIVWANLGTDLHILDV